MISKNLRYALLRPLLQLLANIHWHKKGYKIDLEFLLKYVGIPISTLDSDVKDQLDKKVVALAKVGGAYVLKNSLAFCVLDYSDKDIINAYKQGALAVVTSKKIPNCPCIVVDNPMFVYAKMANYFRSLSSAPVTAVVGSIGKTTAKLMLGSVYSKSAKTSYENGNFTNITHVLQLCQHFDKSFKQIICEISEANYGTIEAASIALEPKVALITAIDKSHMEEFGDEEEIKRQVCSISKNLAKDGAIIVNKDEFNSFKYLNGRNVKTVSLESDADYVAKNIRTDENGTLFDIYDTATNQVSVIRLNNVWGKHNVAIATQSYAAAMFLGISKDVIIKGLSSYSPQGIRQNFYKTLTGIRIYADCFNAVAKSIESSLSAINNIPISAGKKIAVIADVEEAGIISEQIHLQIVQSVNNSSFDTFISYGPKINKAIEQYSHDFRIIVIRCKNRKEICNYLRKHAKKGDIVLFKSSHAWHLDKCIKRMWPISFYYRNLKEKLPYLLWRIKIELH